MFSKKSSFLLPLLFLPLLLFPSILLAQETAQGTPVTDFTAYFEKGIGYNYSYQGDTTAAIDLRLFENISSPLVLGDIVSFFPSSDMSVNYIKESDKVKEEIVLFSKPDFNTLVFSFQKGDLYAYNQ